MSKGDVSFWAFAFSVIVTGYVALKHSAYAEAQAHGDSLVGLGIQGSYMMVWPGIAVFLMLLAAGIWEDKWLSTDLFFRSSLGGVLPVAVNYGLLQLISRVPNPFNGYVFLAAIPTAVLVPILVFVFAFNGRWPFSIWTHRTHEKNRSA